VVDSLKNLQHIQNLFRYKTNTYQCVGQYVIVCCMFSEREKLKKCATLYYCFLHLRCQGSIKGTENSWGV